MPPAIIAAGVAAAGATAGAVISSKAAKKAAKTQAASAAAQTSEAKANRDYQYNLNAPTIAQGGKAGDTIAALLGLGGDQAAADAGLQTFRNSSGYTDLQREGFKGVNASAFAKGLGDSGATLKALQDRGVQIANSSEQQYIGNLGDLAHRGDQSRGLVAGVGLNTVNSTNAATQNAADASSNAGLFAAGQTSSLIQNLLNTGAQAFGTSYRAPPKLGYDFQGVNSYGN